MSGNKINEKLGLKPVTRVRQATHSSHLAPALRCPSCRSRHVLVCQSSNATKVGDTHWCASSLFWNQQAIARVA